MTDCRFVQRHLGAFVDGELDPGSMVAIDRHVDACVGCQESLGFERVSRSLVRQSLSGAETPTGLRSRLSAALDAAPAPASRPSSIRWQVVGGAMGSVAAVALFVVMGASQNAFGGLSASAFSVRPMLEDVVRLHSSALPADVPATPDAAEVVPQYFQGRVAFPVRPARFRRSDVRFLGARYANVQARNAVALFYDVGGSRVTVVVYEAPPLAGDPSQRMRLGSREIAFEDVHGHAVPVRSQGSIHYAFTGDLDRRSLLELAADAQVY